jgi:hypothetical protein
VYVVQRFISWLAQLMAEQLVAKLTSLLILLGLLLASSNAYAAQNYTDQDIACLRVCRDERKCFGSSGARDNSPRCKKCVSDCARSQKKTDR